jgi:F-type H+-transporting ATPase subunit epsilon
VSRKSFDCTVVTPTAALVSGKVVHAVVPLWDGSIGFLPDHAPLLARLGKGELRLEFADTGKGQGGTTTYKVDSGFVKMSENKLTILAEKAEG